MHREWFIASVLFCCTAGGFAQDTQPAATPPDEPAPTFATAQELAGRGRLDQAMTILTQLAARSPEPAGVERLQIGRAHV